jgi:hypothetical protein
LIEDKMEEIVALFLGKDKRIAQRAAAIMMTIADISPDVFAPFLNQSAHHLSQKPNRNAKAKYRSNT